MQQAISPGRWTPAEMMGVAQVGDVHVAPDGLRVLYAVTETVPATVTDDGLDATGLVYRTHLHLAATDGSGTVQLTAGDFSATRSQWSPDGRHVAFLSNRSGRRDIFLVEAQGGEAVQLTATASAVENFKWSPDGRQIAFIMADDRPDVRAGADVRLIGAGVPMNHLWLLPVDAAVLRPADDQDSVSVRRLTQGDFNVDPIFPQSFNWSPDGGTIAFSHVKAPQQGNLWPVYGNISTVDVDSGQVTPLVRTDATSFGPIYSPDGQWLAYAHIERPTWPGTGDLFVLPAAGGEARRLHPTFDRKPLPVGWSADGSAIYYTETLGTVSRIGALPVDGAEPVALGPQQEVLSTVNLNQPRTHMGCVLENLTSPPEAYVLDLQSPAPARKVSSANRPLPEHALGRTELISWEGEDGLEIEGLLTFPVGHEAGSLCPLILDLHGGPHWFFSQVFIANPRPYVFPLAAFAASGFAVLRCNIRGSGGYGRAFRFEVLKDLGGKDFSDAMAGVDRVVDMGVADPQAMGVLGWSYGGYLSAWTITQTQRFKAACMLAPVTNLVSFTGTTDNHDFIPGYLGNEFWEDPTLFLERSPIMQANGVTTPALLLHGEEDSRVPICQSFEFRDALLHQGCEVEMVAYPRMGHGPAEAVHQLDIMERSLAWFQRHLGSS